MYDDKESWFLRTGGLEQGRRTIRDLVRDKYNA